jgi:nucleoside phosphorylase
VTCFVCAFRPEALPLIRRYRLEKTAGGPFPRYEAPGYTLILTGMGKARAADAVAALFAHCPPRPETLLVNVGICAAPSAFPVGSLVVPGVLVEEGWRCELDPASPVTLRTVDAPQDTPLAEAADMEATAICRAALPYLPASRMLFTKVVSDHFDPDSVDIARVPSLIDSKLDAIEALVAERERPSVMESFR